MSRCRQASLALHINHIYGRSYLSRLLQKDRQDGIQFVLLGTGDKEWEEKLKGLENENKKNISINIKFDLDLALLIYQGSDFLVVPSKYEPCGLIQMIAMWYGTLPVVHAVGGLRDTVEDGVPTQLDLRRNGH